jgi:uncharacterized membrane protein YhhN
MTSRFTTEQRALAAFLGALLVQVVLVKLPALPWAILVRPLPLLVLAVQVAREVPPGRAWPVVLGLALGGCGDAAMTLRHHAATQAPLLVAMGLFLAGHVAYVTAFASDRPFQRRRLPAVSVFVSCAVVATLLLFPRLGELGPPVVAYAAVLIAMTALAALRRSDGPGGWRVAAGAALFFVSDLVIGARLATPAVPVPILALILPSYYLGQYWIARGFIRDTAACQP